MHKALGIVACGAVLGVAAVVLLNTLGEASLMQHDEGTYAQVVGESLERGDFIHFTLNGQDFFEKPPLYFWLAGLMSALTSDPTLGIRLPAALGAVLLVGATMLLAHAFTGSFFAAAVAGAVLLWTEAYVMGAREARLDILVSLFSILAAWSFWRGLYNPRWLLLFGAMVGLAVLSKSVVAVFALVPAIFLILCMRRFDLLREKYLWWGAVLGLVVALPWHLHEWLRFGNVFWEQYIGVHVLERYQENLFGDPALQTDYPAHLRWFAGPITGLLIFAALLVPLYWRELPAPARAGLLAMFATLLCMGLVFFSAQTRALSYLLPLYPVAAVAIAMTAHGLWLLVKRGER